MTIVMGLDQHRAQITAEWIDLASGEISRARVRPADRAGARRFLSRFRALKLDVALHMEVGLSRGSVDRPSRLGVVWRKGGLGVDVVLGCWDDAAASVFATCGQPHMRGLVTPRPLFVARSAV